MVEDLGVGGRVAARRASDRGLVDVDDLVDEVLAGEGAAADLEDLEALQRICTAQRRWLDAATFFESMLPAILAERAQRHAELAEDLVRGFVTDLTGQPSLAREVWPLVRDHQRPVPLFEQGEVPEKSNSIRSSITVSRACSMMSAS